MVKTLFIKGLSLFSLEENFGIKHKITTKKRLKSRFWKKIGRMTLKKTDILAPRLLN